MRRFFVLAFVVSVFFISAAGAAPAAHAQSSCPSGQFADIAGNCFPTQAAADASTANLNANNELGSPAQQAATGQGTAAQQAAAAQTPVTPEQTPKLDSSMAGIMSFIMSLFAWLLGVAAITLDNTVYYTIVTMGSYVHNLAAIGVTWRVLRDLGNIMLIFGFLAAGIMTILNTEWYGWGTKMLPKLLLAAVFLNFSLFIAEAIIDTGNLFATQFYTQINGGVPAGAKNFDLVSVSNEGISNKIMSQLGLAQIYGSARTDSTVLKAGSSVFIGFMSILVFLIAAFVMFSLAFILIARFVILVFLIILAPVGFAGWAIPKLEHTAGRWWSKLVEQTITAPVLLLLLYIALAVITDGQFIIGAVSGGPTASPNWTGFVNGNLTGFGSVILSFLVAMGLLLLVVVQAKSLSAFGADWATKTAGKLTFGATAFGLRSTAGLGSQFASQAIRRSALGGTKTGRLLAGTFDRGAKATFDVRGATVFGGLKGGLGIDAGKPAEGGYRGRLERSAKGHEEYSKSVSKAIIEHGLPEQEAIIAQAKAAKAKADEDVAAQEADVKRLAEINSSNRSKGIYDQQSTDAFKRAQERLAAFKQQQTAAAATFEKESKKTEFEAAKEAQKQYAKNIQGSFFGNDVRAWALFGPGGAVAARKIIKEADKSAQQRLLETLQKSVEKSAEEPKSEKTQETPTESKGKEEKH